MLVTQDPNNKPVLSWVISMERRLLARNKVSTVVYMSVPGGRFHRCRAKNLSAMGVFLEIKAMGLPAGTVVNLVFAVTLGSTIRLHRRRAIVTHINDDGAGLMMQGRPRSGRKEVADGASG